MDRVSAELIDTQARDWFALTQSGSMTDIERTRLHEWLQASADNRAAYRQLELIWRDLGDIARSEEGAALRRSVAPEPGARLRSALAAVKRRFILFAPALACIALVAWAVLFYPAPSITVQRHVSAVAELRQLRLADGSRVTLGADSALRTWHTETARFAELERGQAFFDVSGDPLRPFWVHTDDARINVVGTQFDVLKSPGRLSVSVLEGVVNVTPRTAEEPPEPVVVKAGQRVIKARRGSFAAVESVSAAELAAWRHGRLVYRDAPLADVIADLDRYHTGTLVLSGRQLGSLKVTVAVNTDQVDLVPDLLARSLPIKVSRGPGGDIVFLPDYEAGPGVE